MENTKIKARRACELPFTKKQEKEKRKLFGSSKPHTMIRSQCVSHGYEPMPRLFRTTFALLCEYDVAIASPMHTVTYSIASNWRMYCALNYLFIYLFFVLADTRKRWGNWRTVTAMKSSSTWSTTMVCYLATQAKAFSSLRRRHNPLANQQHNQFFQPRPLEVVQLPQNKPNIPSWRQKQHLKATCRQNACDPNHLTCWVVHRQSKLPRPLKSWSSNLYKESRMLSRSRREE